MRLSCCIPQEKNLFDVIINIVISSSSSSNVEPAYKTPEGTNIYPGT